MIEGMIKKVTSKNANQKTMMSAHGKSAIVFHTLNLSRQGVHEMHVRVKCGQINVAHKITIGPDDAIKKERGTPLTTEQIQILVDNVKQKLVDEASFKEIIRQNVENVK